jgi:hypothetical protein
LDVAWNPDVRLIKMMIKRIIQNFIRIIQKILVTLSLPIVYFLGFGITLIFMMVFNRKVLTSNSKDDNTFWVKATEYEANIEDSMRQS